MWQPKRFNPHRIGVLVHEARLYADPDRAVADHDRAMESRKVECRYGAGAPGTGEAWLVLDEADLVAFDSTVGGWPTRSGRSDIRAAWTYAVPMPSGSWPTRRRRLTSSPVDPTVPDADHDPAVCAAEDIAHDAANPFRRPDPAVGG